MSQKFGGNERRSIQRLFVLISDVQYSFKLFVDCLSAGFKFSAAVFTGLFFLHLYEKFFEADIGTPHAGYSFPANVYWGHVLGCIQRKFLIAIGLNGSVC